MTLAKNIRKYTFLKLIIYESGCFDICTRKSVDIGVL